MNSLESTMPKVSKISATSQKGVKARITLDTRTLAQPTGKGKLNPGTIKRIVNAYVAAQKKK